MFQCNLFAVFFPIFYFHSLSIQSIWKGQNDTKQHIEQNAHILRAIVFLRFVQNMHLFVVVLVFFFSQLKIRRI